MAKTIKNPIELKLVFQHNDGIWEVDSSVHYGVGCEEYPVFETRKGIPVMLTEVQEENIIRIATNVVYPQIQTHEGI